MTYDHWKTTNPDDEWLGPAPDDEAEVEAILDAQAAEQEVDDWLASWSDDFNSDEWLEAAVPNTVAGAVCLAEGVAA